MSGRCSLRASLLALLLAAAPAPAHAATKPADLAISVASVGQAVAGQVARFDVTVSNHGGTSASSAEVTFAPQAADGPLSATGQGWACTPSQCMTSTDVAPGAALPPLTVLAPLAPGHVPSAQYGSVQLSAYVGGDDAVAEDDFASASLAIRAAGFRDAALTVRPPATPPLRGQAADFQAIVTNVGAASIASRVEVVFAGSLSGQGSGWACPTGAGRCVTDADVVAGAGLPPLTLQVPTDANAGTSSAGVSATLETADDLVHENDGGSALTPLVVLDGADLALSMRSGPPAVQGAPATAFVTVANAGATASSGTVEVAYSPADASAGGAGWTCPVGAGSCVTSASVAAGGTLPELEVQAPTDLFTSARAIGASVSGGDDGLVLNDFASLATPVSRLADPVDVLATGAAHVDAATRTVSWAVDVRNAGLAPASGDTLVVLEPPSASAAFGFAHSLAFAAAGSGWACTSRHCVHPGPLAAGAALPPLVQTATLPPDMRAGSVSFGATVQSDDDDFTDNDTLSATLTSGGVGTDLGVTVAADAAVTVGDTSSGTVRVRNLGSEASSGPVQVDVGSTTPGAAVSGQEWACGSDLVCTHPGPVAAGQALPTLTVAGPTTPHHVATQMFAATVRTADDEVPLDDSGNSTYGVGGVADDVVPLLDASGPWKAGEVGHASVTVANAGLHTRAAPVTVRIVAPAETVPRGDGWTCTSWLECTHAGPIAPGASPPAIELLTRLPLGQGPTTMGLSATLVAAGDDFPYNDAVSAGVSVVAASHPATLQVALTRDHGGDAIPGQTEHVALTVRNAAATDAPGPFSVRVTPSRSVAIESIDGAGWSCDAASVCQRVLSLASGDATALDLTVRTSDAASALESVLASARQGSAPAVTASLPLPRAVVSGVDLLQEVSTTGPTPAGAPAQFRIRVRNGGEATERGRVQLELAAGGRYADAIVAGGDGWSCPREAERCVTDADVPPGGALPDLVATVPASGGMPGGSVSLRSDIVGVDDDAYPANDTGQARSPIVAQSGVDLVPSVVLAQSLKAGAPATATLTVRNLGSEAADGQVALGLQALGSVSGTLTGVGSGWQCANLRCLHPGPVAAGGALPPLTLTVATPRDRNLSSPYGQVTVTATVAHPDDAVDANDTASTSAPLFASNGVDLVYSLRTEDPVPGLDEPISFRGTVRNVGDDTATTPITVDLPGSWLASGSGWACPRGSGQCVTSADVAAGDELPQLTLIDPSMHDQPGQATASGSVESDQDSEPDNDSASAAAPVAPAPGADLVATLVPSGTTAPGDTAHFVAVVHNPGDGASSGTTTVVLEPPTATATGSGWSCDDATCTTNAIAPAGGELPALTISRPTTVDVYAANASLHVSGGVDASPANDEAFATAGLQRNDGGADVRLAGDLDAPTRQGDGGTWHVSAANDGAAITDGPVTVNLQRPELSTTFSHQLDATAAGPGWSCDALSCTHAALTAGATSAPISLTFSAPSRDALGFLRLQASASPGSEADPYNNALDVGFGIGGVLHDLAATLSSPSGVRADETLTQVATVRNVASRTIAGPVTLAIAAPGGDTVASGSGWSCTQMACTHAGPVAAGATLPGVSIVTPAPAADAARTFVTSIAIDAAGDELGADDGASVSAARGIARIDLAPEVIAQQPVHQGETAHYDITVRNGGTRSSAHAWTLVVSAPDGATASGTGWVCTSTLSCAAASPVVTSHGTLPPLHVNVPAELRDGLGAGSVAASIAQSDDQYTWNNAAWATTGIGGPAVDLTAVVKPLGHWRAGSVATFEADIANAGSAPANGDVNVSLNAPYPGATATGEDWVCTTNLFCVHGGPLGAGEQLPPLDVSVAVPGSAVPTALSAGVSVDNDADRITSNNDAELITGVERKLELRRAALFDGEVQRSRLPRGGATPVFVRFADGVDPQQGQLSALLPAGIQLDPTGTGTGLAHPVSEQVAGGIQVTWDVIPDADDSARTFTVSATAQAPVGQAVIALELTSELTASPESDDAPVTLAAPALIAASPEIVARAADQTISVSGIDVDPSYRLVLRREQHEVVGSGTVSSATAATALFDLSGVEPGPATLVLETAEGDELASLPDAITVAAPVYRDPQITITAPGRVRLNTEAFAYVSVFNPSNVDIKSVPLIVSTPPGVELRPDGTGGRELLADTIARLASDATPQAQRLSPADRDDIIAQLPDAPPVETDPQTGGQRTVVTMPRIPAGGTARLRVGVLPRVIVTGSIDASVPIDRALFARAGEVVDFAARMVADASPPLTAAPSVAAPSGDGCVDFQEGDDVCSTIRLYGVGFGESRRVGQKYACVSYTGVTYGTVGADCQIDETGTAKRVVKKKFPLLAWYDRIRSAFGLYDDLSDAADRIEAASPSTQFGATSVDPNDKLGPAGYGAGHWITGDEPLVYTIRFENIRSATAAAQQVRVTDELPPGLDAASVELVGAEVGGTAIPLTTAAGASDKTASGAAMLDALTGRDVLLDVDVDIPDRRLTATFRGSPHLDDPIAPTAFGDFLPPDDDQRGGEGSLTLTASATPGLPTGTTISNVAAIVFDPHAGGPTIQTPPATNRLDRTAPTVGAPSGSPQVGEPMAFTAADVGAGIGSLTVTPIREGTAQAEQVLDPAARSFAAPATPGTYRFDVRAVDGVGRATAVRSDAIVVRPAATPPPSTGAPGPGTGEGAGAGGSGSAGGPGGSGVTAPRRSAGADAPRIAVPAKLKRAALRKGLTIRLGGLRASSAITLRVQRGKKTLATLNARASRAGDARLTVKLTRRQLSSLASTATLALRFTVVSADGRRQTVTKRVAIARRS